jgi:hypothetical protein
MHPRCWIKSCVNSGFVPLPRLITLVPGMDMTVLLCDICWHTLRARQGELTRRVESEPVATPRRPSGRYDMCRVLCTLPGHGHYCRLKVNHPANHHWWANRVWCSWSEEVAA